MLRGGQPRACASRCIHSHRDALPATDLAWIGAAANYPRDCCDAGVVIYENLHGEHSKIVVVDDRVGGVRQLQLRGCRARPAGRGRCSRAAIPRAVDPALAIFDDLRRSSRQHAGHAASRSAVCPARVQARIARYGRFKWWI
ncbi:MAG: hypothetical protein MZW92_52850 [Comamonadaceae bacterium]|nr:hypothetical protein [Comamonadaceae bacterium]